MRNHVHRFNAHELLFLEGLGHNANGRSLVMSHISLTTWIWLNHIAECSTRPDRRGGRGLRKVLFGSNLLRGCSVSSSENRPKLRSPVPATVLRHNILTQRLMASLKARTKSSCYHMSAALKPPSLRVYRAASRLPNFRIRRSATERPPASPSGR